MPKPLIVARKATAKVMLKIRKRAPATRIVGEKMEDDGWNEKCICANRLDCGLSRRWEAILRHGSDIGKGTGGEEELYEPAKVTIQLVTIPAVTSATKVHAEAANMVSALDSNVPDENAGKLQRSGNRRDRQERQHRKEAGDDEKSDESL
jgi:hypothetical protein